MRNDHQPKARAEDRQLQHDIRLLQVYNYYRLIVALILVTTYFNEAGKAFIGLDHPQLFLFSSAIYLLVTVTMVFLFRSNIKLGTDQIVLNIFIDIVSISLMVYASGGVENGLGNLLIFVVAAGSILLSGAYAYLFAALGSIAIILLEVYRVTMDVSATHHHVQAGLLGTIFFATAIFIKQIAKRLRTSENLAIRQESDIEHLEKLNKLIIQRMRTGIVVCSREGQVTMYNEAALELIADKRANNSQTKLSTLPSPLMQRLIAWKQNPAVRTSPFRTVAENPKVQANFTSLRQEDGQDVLIFLEDSSKVMQQAQQLKLASLGQLTASIAHEIRNPLGAISHASQLLSESENLGKGDERLVDIIQDHAKRMNITIENILELSRRRTPTPSSIMLSSWLKDFVHTYNRSEQNPGKFNIRVEPSGLEVQMDPNQFAQVITNLCNNGLRFSREHTGEAILDITAGINPESELPYIDIVDHGPGVAESALPHLFEPFFTTGSKGTGLGLYISRELCEANNARLDHIDAHKEGCCFRIVFPHPKKLAA